MSHSREHDMDRRSFLKVTAGVGAASCMEWSGGVLASGPSGSGKLLVVMLRGAYDSANFLAPVNAPDYHDARPTIALGRPGSGKNEALALEGQWGLHPSAGAVMGLYKARQAAFIPFSGNEGAPRSHFEAQDLMESGLAVGARSGKSNSGWMGRLVERVGSSGVGAMSFTSNLALSLKGNVSVPNGSAGSLGKAQDPRSAKMMRELYGGSALEAMVMQGVDARERVARELSEIDARDRVMEAGKPQAAKDYEVEMKAADRGARVAGSGLSAPFAKMGKLMAVDPKASIAFVDVGGWDTHVNQGGATGQFANKLQALSEALGAYASAMGPSWRDTTVLVLSEFGRAFKENGNRGTDHGHGAAMWALGGAVRGGRIAGRDEAVSYANLNEKRDFKVLNDYRGVASEVVAKLYGLGAKDLDYILPGAPKLGLGLL